MDEIEKAVPFAYQAELVRICAVSSLTITFYDHFILFDDEVEAIWKKSWSMNKAMYLVNRYLGAIIQIVNVYVFMNEHPSPAVSHTYFRVEDWVSVTLCWIMQVLLQLRLYAIYQRSKKIRNLMIGAFAFVSLLGMIVFVLTQIKLQVGSELHPGIYMCAILGPHWLGAAIIPLMAFDILLFSLALYAYIRHVKEFRAMGHATRKSLIALLLQDNVWYFLIIASWYTVCGVVLLIYPTYIAIPVSFSMATTTIAGCRLVLNMCKGYYQPFADGSSPSTAWAARRRTQDELGDISLTTIRTHDPVIKLKGKVDEDEGEGGLEGCNEGRRKCPNDVESDLIFITPVPHPLDNVTS